MYFLVYSGKRAFDSGVSVTVEVSDHREMYEKLNSHAPDPFLFPVRFKCLTKLIYEPRDRLSSHACLKSFQKPEYTSNMKERRTMVA